MTPEQLAEIRARCDKATRGPWRVEAEQGAIAMGEGKVFDWIAQTWPKCEEDFPNATSNGRFIAHSRQDIPALLAYIAELEDATRWRYPPEMPTTNGDYLVRHEYAGEMVQDVAGYTFGTWWVPYLDSAITPTAWQPLPEPAPIEKRPGGFRRAAGVLRGLVADSGPNVPKEGTP